MAGAKKLAYIVRLKFPAYEAKPFRSTMTIKQADDIAAMLEKYKKEGVLEDFYLGPPDKIERLHALILSAEILKIELRDLIEMEKRRPPGV
jgi:hypothetical protein